MTRDEARTHKPTVVRVDGDNRPLGDEREEQPGPVLHSLPAPSPPERGCGGNRLLVSAADTQMVCERAP